MIDELVKDDVTSEATTETTQSSDTTKDSSTDLVQNPEAMADLLKQLNDASKTIKDLQSKTASYEKEKANATRAQQTREQQLEGDLTEAQKIIEKMDSVIRHTAIINAIQGIKDYEFHSARHVLNELE